MTILEAIDELELWVAREGTRQSPFRDAIELAIAALQRLLNDGST